ncbi:MAG: hypothetical protein ACK5LC_17510 [Coprobacillaceae bacterium]
MINITLPKRKKATIESGNRYLVKKKGLLIDRSEITIIEEDENYYYYNCYLPWVTNDGIAYEQFQYEGRIEKESDLLKYIRPANTIKQIKIKNHMMKSMKITFEICKGLIICAILSLSIYGMMSLQEFKSIEYKVLNVSDMQIIFHAVLPIYVIYIIISKAAKWLKSILE